MTSEVVLQYSLPTDTIGDPIDWHAAMLRGGAVCAAVALIATAFSASRALIDSGFTWPSVMRLAESVHAIGWCIVFVACIAAMRGAISMRTLRLFVLVAIAVYSI